MFFKKPSHRVFDYPARFYKPEEDEKVKREKKLGFKRQIKIHRKKKNPFIWVVLIIIVIYLYLKLSHSL